MGFLKRCGSLVRGFFGLSLRNVEERNPDILFEDINNRIYKARREAEEQIIEIQTNAEMMRLEMRNAEKKLYAVKERIEAARKKGDKDLLVELLIREEELENAYEANKASYNSAMAEVARIKEDYKIFESEMNARINEIKALKSQAKIASIKENINSLNYKYSSKDSKLGELNRSIEQAREIVNKKTAKANAVGLLNDSSVELKLRRLDLDSARERAVLKAETMLRQKED